VREALHLASGGSEDGEARIHQLPARRYGPSGRLSDRLSPAPVSASLHAGAADRLRAVAVTSDGGTSVHLELWLNGKKLVDYTDRDHPYTKGYLGLYVESISDATSTAGGEFDNFSSARI
jgi:hypothetical protein